MDTQLAPCAICKEKKPFDQFYKSKGRRPYGLTSACKPCSQQKRKEWHEKNDSRETKQAMWRRSNLKRNFNITPEDFDRMFDEQGGVCAICFEPETDVHSATGKVQRLAVDHDKSTGIVRGLLCGRCNKGIGNLRHDRKILESAISYLYPE